MRLTVNPGIPEALRDLTDRFGSTQVSIASRLLQWVSEQPDVMQAAILGVDPHSIQDELPTMVIKAMRSKASHHNQGSAQCI